MNDRKLGSIPPPPDKKQLRDLERVLNELPDELVEASTAERLIELGLEEAHEILADVEPHWRDFRAASKLASAPSPPFSRWLERLAHTASEWSTQAVWTLFLTLTALGATLLPAWLPAAATSLTLALAGALLLNLRLLPDAAERLLGRPLAALGILRRDRGLFSFGAGLLLWLATWTFVVPFLPARTLEATRALAFTLAIWASLMLSANPLLRFYGQDRAIRRERREAAREAYLESLRHSALRCLRARLNLESTRSYQATLTFSDHSGLGEMDDSAREIPTRTRDLLLQMMGRMPGGTIGLAGSRGAGKTTLMRSICMEEGTREKEQEPLGVVVDAPVSYEPRDFVLYLFARICTEVVGAERVREMRGSDQPFGFPAISSWVILTSYRWVLGIGCLVAGLALMVIAALQATDALKSPFAWGLVLIFIGYASITVQTFSDWQRRRRLSGEGRSDLASADDPNIHTATLRLRQIWFQQSFSSGWSGGFKTPIGVETGLNGSTELAEQQLSFPDIVDLFRDFLRQVALRREVRIGIDELDKMDDDTARRFLNEIKVIFRVPDCFFFVSISEDAMSFFERRGLPIRDVFDSSFDDVLHVPHLEFAISKELLDRRIVGLPIPFACFLHCASGGLPRDLIRAARNLVQLEKGTPLTSAASELLMKSLHSKAHATKVAARGFQSEDHVTVLIAWLDRVQTASFTATGLLDICRDFEVVFLEEVAALALSKDLVKERRELQALGTQLVAFAYYAATTLQFFEHFSSPTYTKEATGVNAALGNGTCTVDKLAAVTQTFAVDVNAAWGMLTRFREDLNLGPSIPFPHLPKTQDEQMLNAATDGVQTV